MPLKQSINQYRVIKGIRYEMYTSNPGEFAESKKWAKSLKLKYRIIDDQFYIEYRTFPVS